MVVHKGWDWTNETSDSWLKISEEFLPIALHMEGKVSLRTGYRGWQGKACLFLRGKRFCSQRGRFIRQQHRVDKADGGGKPYCRRCESMRYDAAALRRRSF